MDIDNVAPLLPAHNQDRRKNRALRRLISVGNLLAAQSTQPQLRDAWERALASIHSTDTVANVSQP